MSESSWEYIVLVSFGVFNCNGIFSDLITMGEICQYESYEKLQNINKIILFVNSFQMIQEHLINVATNASL